MSKKPQGAHRASQIEPKIDYSWSMCNAAKRHKPRGQLERPLFIETVYALNDMSAAFFIRNTPANRGNLVYVQCIMSKDCPVSASLTDHDKAKLLEIKQDAEQKFAPSPASKKEK
jgi:hypothetical protein